MTRVEIMKIAQALSACKWLGQIQTQDWFESHMTSLTIQSSLPKSFWGSWTLLHKPFGHIPISASMPSSVTSLSLSLDIFHLQKPFLAYVQNSHLDCYFIHPPSKVLSCLLS